MEGREGGRCVWRGEREGGVCGGERGRKVCVEGREEGRCVRGGREGGVWRGEREGGVCSVLNMAVSVRKVKYTIAAYFYVLCYLYVWLP